MSIRDLTILGSSSQQPTRYRNHGAYLFRWLDSGLLFDPGEGTQRQFIFAGIAPPVVNYIFVSHFHGDHCLGLGSFLMRLNLDKVAHPVHCFYPASGKKYFDRLRYGTIYHEVIEVIEHPIDKEGVVYQDDKFTVHAAFLKHGVDSLGWRVTEPDMRKFDKEKLKANGIRGPMVKELQEKGALFINGKTVSLDDVSWIRKGESIAVVIDTLPCQSAFRLAQGARILLCESTYLDNEKDLAKKHFHLTAKQAAEIAQEAGAEELILTHFSARYTDSSLFEKEAREVFPNAYSAEDFKTFPFPLKKGANQ